MSILNKYNLIVEIKFFSQFGGIKSIIVRCTEKGSDNGVLSCLGHLDKLECVAFLEDMDWCLKNQSNVGDGFITDGIEYLAYGIIYEYPNVIIDNMLTLPMQDMKEILEELLKYF